jgi:hypothetical protein
MKLYGRLSATECYSVICGDEGERGMRKVFVQVVKWKARRIRERLRKKARRVMFG